MPTTRINPVNMSFMKSMIPERSDVLRAENTF